MPKDFGLLAKVIPLSTPAIVLLIFTKNGDCGELPAIRKLTRLRKVEALGVSVNKRRPWARLGRTRPARALIFAQNAPNDQHDRQEDSLNGWRRN